MAREAAGLTRELGDASGEYCCSFEFYEGDATSAVMVGVHGVATVLCHNSCELVVEAASRVRLTCGLCVLLVLLVVNGLLMRGVLILLMFLMMVWSRLSVLVLWGCCDLCLVVRLCLLWCRIRRIGLWVLVIIRLVRCL